MAKVLWNEMGVTVEVLADCLDAIDRQPVRRHDHLLLRLLMDHEWKVGRTNAEANIMRALWNHRRADPVQPQKEPEVSDD